MSRIGKTPIIIPAKTEVSKKGDAIVVKGPLGELSRVFAKEVTVTIEGNTITVAPVSDTIFARALWGTVAAHIKNMIHGVNEVFTKKLILEGVGFKSAIEGKNVLLNIGFSHPVRLAIPEGLKVTAEKNLITVTGIDKEAVGSFAALLRSQKKPEPYKGKGMRYEKEVIKRKEGKKTA
jgi:large subunit ribosomal protein L6